jgi:hypothetical protein
VLEGHGNAELCGLDGIADDDGAVAEPDLAPVRRNEADEDLHQRGLAGAVLAEQPVDLADPDRQVDLVAGDDLAVALADLQHLERMAGARRFRKAADCGFDDRHVLPIVARFTAED